MDWMTISVLKQNLGETLEQLEGGKHLEEAPVDPDFPANREEDKLRVSDDWWMRLVSLTNSMSLALNAGERFESTRPERGFGWLTKLPQDPCIKAAERLYALSRKLLADRDDRLARWAP